MNQFDTAQDDMIKAVGGMKRGDSLTYYVAKPIVKDRKRDSVIRPTPTGELMECLEERTIMRVK